MDILTTPLNSVERQAARTAAIAAMSKQMQAGIRPSSPTPRRKTSGVRVANFNDMDNAISAARNAWPETKNFSVFGADKFTPGHELGAITSEDLPWLAQDVDGMPHGGDGCFEGATDYGEFSCDPHTTLDMIGSADANNGTISEGPMLALETPPEGC